MSDFSVTGSIRFGWEAFWKRPLFLAGATLLAIIVHLLVSSALSELVRVGMALAIIAWVLNIAFGTYFNMGVVNFLLVAKERVADLALRDFWRPHPFWKFFWANVLVGVCFLLALIGSLVVSGIAGLLVYLVSHPASGVVFLILLVALALASFLALGVTFMFVVYLVLARDLGPTAALKESMRLTEGYRLRLLGLLVLMALINILGAICVLVGLLVTIPVTALAAVHAYRTLEQKKSAIIS